MHPLAVLLTLLVLLWVGSRIQAVGVRRQWYPMWVGRKTAHVGAGLVVLLSWLVYPEEPPARWFAAAPFALTTLYFFALARGWIDDPGTVEAGSRSGTPAGMLRGPIHYALVFTAITVVFWRESPLAVATLAFLVLGDGAGEVVGRTISSPRLPWSPEKSVAGSLGVLAAGWVGGFAILALFVSGGWLPGPWTAYLTPMAWVALAGTAVESLPMPELDNLTVPAVCLAVGWAVF